jgi:RHS repeat-associated protein
VIQSYAYTLGPAGNRERIVEADGTVRAYQYDDLYRLTRETISNALGPVYEKSFVYDPVGNRLNQTTTGEDAAVADYTYDDRDRLLTENSTAYGWDDDGNLTSKSGDATYSWDFENRLVRVEKTDGTVVTHAYDADGNRVRTEVTPPTGPPQVTQYLVDTTGSLSHVVAETDGSGTLLALYSRGDDLLGVVRTGEQRFFHADGLSSVRFLTDESGNVADNYEYSAFGEPLTRIGLDQQPYTFAGEPFDSNLGFYYNRARWMDPVLGRFTTPDSFSSNELKPLTAHRYAYALNDPQTLVDPTGLFTQSQGYAVERALQPFYAASHPGEDFQFGKWARVGLRENLKPDVLNRSRKTFLEIKPFSLSGIGSAGIQMALYLTFLVGYTPEADWVPPATVDAGGVVALVNLGGIIFYTDLLDNVEEIIAIKTWENRAALIQILRGAPAIGRNIGELGRITRLAVLGSSGGQVRLSQQTGTAMLLTTMGGFAF